ncbi:MAG: 2OG-Fe(II) oxygenase [Candidatus Nitrosopumilus sp. bin_6a]
MLQTWPSITIDHTKIQQNNKKINEITEGKFSVLIIKNFYDVDSCNTIIQRINSNAENQEGATKIGVSLVSHITRKKEYFIQANIVRKTLREIFFGAPDPLKKIHNLLRELFPNKEISIAVENGKKYACGVIRLHGLGDSASIHRDNASYEAKNFDISKFSIQLSIVLYIQQSEKGGELVLYKKAWEKSDEKFRNIEFGYKRDVVANSTHHVKIKPNQGDLVIINPNHYHEILPVKGSKRRITLGLFLSFSKYGKKIVTWS